MTDPDKPSVTDDPPPAARIVGGLFRSRNIVWDNDHRVVGRFGLTWTEFLTLLALRRAGPEAQLTPTQLYSATQASSGGITKMLHSLTDKGLVARVDNPKDRRGKLVQMTPEGADLTNRIVEALIETNTALFGDILTEEECVTLATLLQKLARGLQASPAAGTEGDQG